MDSRSNVIPQLRWREENVWDVFEPDGRYVGQVKAPDSFIFLAAEGDGVWGQTRNELGVPFVTRYGLSGGKRPAGVIRRQLKLLAAAL